MLIKLEDKLDYTIEESLTAVKKLPNRVRIVDVLRGFALLGILLIHSLQRFSNTTRAVLEESSLSASILQGFIEFLTEDKFYIIFSFLFGWSFNTMYANALKKQRPFVKAYLWRLGMLLIIGLLHSLFYSADILQIYAFVGVILVVCRNVKFKNLLIISLLMLILSTLCIYYQHHLLESMTQLRETGIIIPTKLNYNIVTGRLFITCGIFVLGLALGKVHFLERLSGSRSLQKRMIIQSGCIFLITSIALTLIKFYHLPSTNDFVRSIHIICFTVQNLSLSYLYVFLITLLYFQTFWSKFLRYLIALGRVGMSAYLMQSLFLLLFYTWKDGFDTDLPRAMTITLLFFLVQIALANIWLSHFKYGPAEWLWRKMSIAAASSK